MRDAGMPDVGPDATVDAGPIDLCSPDPMCTIVRIAAGRFHTCALRDSGRIDCWGSNEEGQLGDGTMDMLRREPAPVPGFAAIDVDAGGSRTCAVDRVGDVWCWGNGARNPVRTLGRGASKVRLSAGGNVCFLRDGGPPACMATGFGGILGAPVDVPGFDEVLDIAQFRGTTCVAARRTPEEPFRVFCDEDPPRLEDAVELTAGGQHVCARTLGGEVFCWGQGTEGQLGQGSFSNADAPVRVVGVGDAVAVAAGFVHTCARRESGRVSCWGRNQNAQLGDGSTTNRNEPVRTLEIGDSLELGAGLWHSCARRASDAVFCWGSNSSGQLGDGTLTDRDRPARVLGLP